MLFAAVFLVGGALLVWQAARAGGPWWLLGWFGLSLIVIGVGYAGAGARVFGKRPDGRLAWWAWALHAPFFVVNWLSWRAQGGVSRQPRYHEVAPGLWLGRRIAAADLPPGANVVVDLTAEFWCPRRTSVDGRAYLCLPTLDASVADDDQVAQLVERVSRAEGVYLHCAAGHGRSATVAAAVLIARGAARDADEAVKMLKSIRRGVRLTPAQKRTVRRLAARATVAPPPA